eukprot:TRINITY_DN30765_c0_g1_i1.p2 TRINITY_DN30765_c0_g1~~TRINITY_DN30765_c0_g1_i1.p2  ORF type:complete len:279 (-),score=95.79 TRINITY_DN30765_c0_g1_i1:172-1008(-)
MQKLRKIVSGNAKGPTLLFVHGWPDDASLFEPMAKQLEPTYRCVRVTLPNYGPLGPENPQSRRGVNLDEIVALLHEAVLDVQRDAGRPEEPVTLVLHDWGCTFGYELEARYPDLVRGVVGLDIGLKFNMGPMGALGVLVYQWYLIGAWLIGQVLPPIGNALTRAYARLGGAPQAAVARSTMNYPYFWFWYYMFFRRGNVKQQRQLRTRGLAPFPMLFLYGTRKPFLLPSEKWLAAVRARPDSDAKAYDAGHWFFLGKYQDDVNSRVSAWLDKLHSARK